MESDDLWSRGSPARARKVGKVVRACARAHGHISRKERDTRGGSSALRRPEIRVTGQDGGGFRAGSGRTLRRAEPSRAEVSRIVVWDPVPPARTCTSICRAADRALSRVIDFVGGSPLRYAGTATALSRSPSWIARARARARSLGAHPFRFRMNRSLIDRISHWNART